MPQRNTRNRRRKADTVIRHLAVQHINHYLSFSPTKERGAPPSLEELAALEISGTLNAPVQGGREAVIWVSPSDEGVKKRLPWTGGVHGISPMLRPSLFLPPAPFDRLWTLAASGRLRFIRVAFSPPRYQSAELLDIAFSFDRVE
jgi:hypothetical protein